MSGNRLAVGAMLLIALSFLAGVLHLFEMRFERGDIYPSYSSLRSDPLGTKVLYESLNNMPGISATRNYKPLHKLSHNPPPSFLYLGVGADMSISFPESDIEHLESVIAQGGRFVIHFRPGYKPPDKSEEHISTETGDNGSEMPREFIDDEKEEADDIPSEEDPVKTSLLSDRWEFALASRTLSCKSDCERKAAGILMSDDYDLPDTIEWHSSFYLIPSDSRWSTVYAVDGRPVLIEKPLGKGKIILATDTYYLSNEAMLKSRYPGLLAWLIGPNSNIIFDETHFGINEVPGIAFLFKKYRLHRPLAGFLLLAMLFIWKNSTSLVPPDDSFYKNDYSGEGKDYISGFVSLLHRNVPAENLIETCYREWERTFRSNKSGSDEALNRIKALMRQENNLPAKRKNPVATYLTIHKLLSKRRYR